MRTVNITLILFICFGFSAHAKRLSPKSLKPISHAGLRYEALPWAYENTKMKQNGGYVRVVNIRNGLPICTKQVYETKYDDQLESDVQDNFITALKIEGNNLLINSEKLAPIQISLAGFCD